MDAEDIEHKRNLLKKYKNNLRIVELQAAEHGSDIPVKMQYDMTFYKEEIQKLASELQGIEQRENSSPLTDTADTSMYRSLVYDEIRYNNLLINSTITAIDVLRKVAKGPLDYHALFIILESPNFRHDAWDNYSVFLSSALEQDELGRLLRFYGLLRALRIAIQRIEGGLFKGTSKEKGDTINRFGEIYEDCLKKLVEMGITNDA